MSNFKVLRPLNHNNVAYEPGEEFFEDFDQNLDSLVDDGIVMRLDLWEQHQADEAIRIAAEAEAAVAAAAAEAAANDTK